MNQLFTKIKLILGFLVLVNISFAQDPGSQATDWTLTDIEGNAWHLQDLLDDGKTIFIEFSATWCGICWNFHNSGTMETLYQQYGPDGSDQIMVFFIETDPTTSLECLYGQNDCFGGSSGNWTAGTSYPIINASSPQSAAFIDEYDISGYPNMNLICPSGRKFPLPKVFNADFYANYINSCSLTINEVNSTNPTCGMDSSGSINVDVTGGYGNITYTFNGDTLSQNIDELSAGTYVFKATDENFIFVQDTITLVSNSEDITIDLIEQSNPSCPGASDGMLIVEANGDDDLDYNWSNGMNGSSISGLTAGIYELTITDTEGCTASETYTLIADESLIIDIEVTAENCGNNDGSITFNSASVEGMTFSIGQEFSSNNTFENLSAGTYYTQVNYDVCQVIDTVVIEETIKPFVMIEEVNEQLACHPDTITLYAENSESNEQIIHQWSTSNGNIVGANNLLTATIDQAGEYILTSTNSTTGCIGQDTIRIENVASPSVDAGEDLNFPCGVNFTTLNATVDDPSDVSIMWTSDDGNILVGGNTLNPVIGQSGLYIIAITDVSTGCTTLDSILVYDSQEELPTSDFTSNINVNTVNFTAEADDSGTTYLWNFGDGQSSTMMNPQHTYESSGNYEVCLTTTNDCGSTVTCEDIVISIDIDVTFTTKNVTCPGGSDGSIDITVSGNNTSYIWSTGEETEDINGLTSGNYDLAIIHSGDTLYYEFDITEPDPWMVIVDSLDAANGVIEITASGGTPPYRYRWSHGSIEQDQYGLDQGNYSVEIKDIKGCVYIVEFVLSSSSSQETLLKNITLYPNPVRNHLYIKSESDAVMQVELIGMTGTVFLKSTVSDHASIPVDNIPSGVILVKIYTNEKMATYRIVKI